MGEETKARFLVNVVDINVMCDVTLVTVEEGTVFSKVSYISQPALSMTAASCDAKTLVVY